MRKDQINEFIDSQLNIIGNEDTPPANGNLETMVDTKTTDQIAPQVHQNYGDDFYARYGFWLYEDKDKSNLRDELAKLSFQKFGEIMSELSKDKSKIDSWVELSNKNFDKLSDEEKKSDYICADKILDILKTKKDKIEESKKLFKIIEDTISSKKKTNDNIMDGKKTKNNDILSKDLKKIKDMIDSLSKTEKELLIKHI